MRGELPLMTKRIGRVTALVLVALALAAVLPWSISDALLRDPVVAQIKAQLGLDAETTGRVTIALLPRPRLKLENVVIRDGAGALVIEAKVIRGDLRLLSLLAGRLELKSISLDTPTLFLDLDGRPFAEGGAIARALRTVSGSPAAVEADRASLASVTISSGLIRLRSASRDFETLVQDVNATLDWQRLGNPALLSGSAVWRGQPTQFDVAIAKPAALLRGEQSGANLRLRGFADVDAVGLLSGSPRIQFEGSVKARTASLRQVARTLDVTIPLPGPRAEAWIEGDASITGTKCWFTDAKMGLDGNTFQGSLAMEMTGGHAALSGTLATDLLQLDGIAAELPPLRGSDGQWSRDPLDLKNLAASELDLRISAARMRLGALQAEDAALSVLLKGGRSEISLADAQAYHGSIKARAIATLVGPNLDLKLSGSFTQLDASAALVAAFGSAWISGAATGQFLFENSGDSPVGIISGLEGRAQIAISQGDIFGINVEQALSRVEKRPLLSASDIHNGRTSFDEANVDFKIERGSAEVAQGVVSGPGARIAFDGRLSFPERTIALKAHARQNGDMVTGKEGGPQIDFAVEGSWDEPRVEPDARTLIRRSDAAAPLLGPHREGEDAEPALPSPFP